jgi:hypothetical protein
MLGKHKYRSGKQLLGIKEIANELGMSRSTTHRYVIIRGLTGAAARIAEVAWPKPEYRGIHHRRAIMVPFGLLFLGLVPEIVFAPVSAERKLVGGLFILVLFGVIELLLVRRLGMTIGKDRLTLHQIASYKRVPWSEIAGFEWQVWGRVEVLVVVKLNSGRALFATSVWRVNNYLEFLGSNKMRSRKGGEVDPLATLERALVSAQG